jgi:hypothetical protein
MKMTTLDLSDDALAAETPYRQFCAQHAVTHGHCPDKCDKPQPQLRDGAVVCCWCSAPIVPCKPELCD